MRHIVRGAEPSCLAKLRATPGADWSSVHGDQKQELRDALCRDQGDLCAYCCRRIDPKETATRVEHWDPRERAPERMFRWTNLLAVCDGRVGSEDHCDRSRKTAPLHLHPALGPDPGSLLRYPADGRVEAGAPYQADLERNVLNLNTHRLVESRRAVINGALHQIAKAKAPGELAALVASVEAHDAQGRLLPYQPVALYYLRRALRKRTGRGERKARAGRGGVKER